MVPVNEYIFFIKFINIFLPMLVENLHFSVNRENR